LFLDHTPGRTGVRVGRWAVAHQACETTETLVAERASSSTCTPGVRNDRVRLSKLGRKVW